VVCAVVEVYAWGSCYVACLYLSVVVLLCSCIWWSVFFGFWGLICVIFYGGWGCCGLVCGVLGGIVKLVNLFTFLGFFFLRGWYSGFHVCGALGDVLYCVGLWALSLCWVCLYVLGCEFVLTFCGVVFFFCGVGTWVVTFFWCVLALLVSVLFVWCGYMVSLWDLVGSWCWLVIVITHTVCFLGMAGLVLAFICWLCVVWHLFHVAYVWVGCVWGAFVVFGGD